MAGPTIDVASLHAALDAARTTRGLSWRQLAGELGLSPSTLTRLANGYNPDVSAFASMVRWLNMSADKFIQDPDDFVAGQDEPDLVATLVPLLRARKDLKPEDVEHLENLISAAVKRFQNERIQRKQ